MPYKNREAENEWKRKDKIKNPEKWKKKTRKEYLQFIEKCRKDPEVWNKKMEKQRESRGTNRITVNHGGIGHSTLNATPTFTGVEYNHIVDLRRKYKL